MRLDLVSKGESLPKTGREVVKAGKSLKAGSSDALNFKLYEGEIRDPIADNRPIGALKIAGDDFDYGVIPVGAVLECEYEIWDSGNLHIDISVPSLGATFSSDHNFYSPKEGLINYTDVADRTMVADEVAETMNRIDEIKQTVDDPKLEPARQKLVSAAQLISDAGDSENVLEANERVLEAKSVLAQVRETHLKEFRQAELTRVVTSFEHVRQYARASEAAEFDTLTETAQRAIDNNEVGFEEYLNELSRKNFDLWWRQPWFVIEQFKRFASSPERFANQDRFEELVAIGSRLLPEDLSPDGKGTGFIDPEKIKSLRPIVAEMWQLQYEGRSETKSMEDMVVNIIMN